MTYWLVLIGGLAAVPVGIFGIMYFDAWWGFALSILGLVGVVAGIITFVALNGSRQTCLRVGTEMLVPVEYHAFGGCFVDVGDRKVPLDSLKGNWRVVNESPGH